MIDIYNQVNMSMIWRIILQLANFRTLIYSFIDSYIHYYDMASRLYLMCDHYCLLCLAASVPGRPRLSSSE